MFKFIAIALMISAFSACAGGPRQEAMIADVAVNAVIAENSPLWKSTAIGDITGSAKTNKLWKSKVSGQIFTHALQESLKLHAVFSEDNGKYTLSARLMELRQPFIGVELTVTARVAYKATRNHDGVVVFDREITQVHTSTLKDSYVFSDRLKLANEGAIKANIKKFIGAYINKSRNFPDLFSALPTTAPQEAEISRKVVIPRRKLPKS